MNLIAKILLCLIGWFVVLPLVSMADTNTTQIGRYLTVENRPLLAQEDLLSQTFQVRFPASVKTIGDAMRYLLQFSGYSLVDETHLIPPAVALLAQPLPAVNRNFGPMTLATGLQTLIGKPFGLFVDPVHRLISLRLLPQYRALYQRNNLLFYSSHSSRN